jgi:SAM-dependent methyltransferase
LRHRASNIDWSTRVQGTLSLDLSRELRFRDDRKDLILHLLGLHRGMIVVDVGCGPGALARKVAQWLDSTSRIIGVDRDAVFVRHASQRASELRLENARFIEGDALALPFRDNSVDACISHTVIEHVPNEPFLREQKRICCAGARVSVAWVNLGQSVVSIPEGVPAMSTREKELWEPIWHAMGDADRAFGIGAHWPDLAGLPRLFQALGFTNVQVDALALPVVPDDSRNRLEERVAAISAERRATLEQLEMGVQLLGHSPREDDIDELRVLVEERFSKRLALARRGESVWDYRVSMVMIVSGAA